MNKKGFTLVELLAVIAIMAILVIIAIPNVLEALNRAKEKAFVDDIYTIYSSARSQFELDKSEGNLGAVEDRKYYYCSSKDLLFTDNCSVIDSYDCSKSLPLKTAGNDTKYIIKLNKEGQVVYMYVNDERYDFLCTDISGCKKVEIIKSITEGCVEKNESSE